MSEKYQMTGTVTEIFPAQKFGSKGYVEREFRIKEKSDSTWPNIVSFILSGDKCELADSLTEGAEVTVHFNINGKIWDKGDGSPTKCFCKNKCWKIDILKKGKPAKPMPEIPEPPTDVGDIDADDLPF